MGITDLDTLVNLVSGGGNDFATPYASVQNLHFYKQARIGGSDLSIGTGFNSTWQWNSIPAKGALVGSTTAIVPDNTTSGGLFQNNPSGGRKLWLAGATIMEISYTLINFMIYDRLIHADGLDATSSSTQTITSGSLTRYNSSTDCLNNQIWLEINTTLGSTAKTASVSYNDANGDARTSDNVTLGSVEYRTQGQTVVVPLNPSYPGVTGINSVTLSGSTGAGSFGIVVARPLTRLSKPGVDDDSVEVANNVVIFPNITEVKANACLAFQTTINQTPVSVKNADFAGCITLVEA